MLLFNAKAVLFDLDGTLVHSAPDLAAAANHMLRELGRATQAEEKIISWVGSGMAQLIKRALTESMDGEPPAPLFERAQESFKAYYAANLTRLTRPYPGTVETLEILQGRGVKLACITNKVAVFTLPLLRQLQLEKYFAVVVSGDTATARKPDPAPLRYACAHFGVDADQALMVGDSIYDVQAARAAGMPIIAVNYGYHGDREPHELAADVVVDSLAEVPQYLRL